MKKHYLSLVVILLLVGLSSIGSSAQLSFSPKMKPSPDGLWQTVNEVSLKASPEIQQQRQIVPAVYRVVQLDHKVLNRLLAQAPMEFTDAARQSPLMMTLPRPDGSFARFHIQESPMMEPELARQVPDIKTYAGYGIDDPTATVRMDWTPSGFHAMILSTEDTVYIDPYRPGDTKTYISYFKHDLMPDPTDHVRCFWEPSLQLPLPAHTEKIQQTGETLRTLRLALAATGEYTAFYGGTKQGALNGMTSTLNRVNGIYERDLAIRLVLIGRQLDIIYTDGNTDPYTNNDPGTLVDENQANLDMVIGDANYDMGHVFSTASGGVGGAGPCITGRKAIGATGLPRPQGDPFDIDFVAHEMIHQFNGGHTFNAEISTGGNSCDRANRSPRSAYEPGSGSTVASYAGICGCADYQRNSDDYFNGNSIDEYLNYFANIAQFGGTDCTRSIPTGNRPPTVNGGPDINVAVNTPFTLTATGSDPDGDVITYCWEQYDLGNPSGCLPDLDDGSRPIFRSFRPTTSPSRTFPSMMPPPPGESLPTTMRTMTFRCTVRDNRGGVAKATMRVRVGQGGGNDQTTVALTSGVAQTGTAPAPTTGGFNLAPTQYTIQVPSGATQVKIDLNPAGPQNVDLYVRFGQRVVTQPMVMLDYTAQSAGPGGSESLTITPTSPVPLRSGSYFIAINNFGPGAATFNVTATVTTGGGGGGDPNTVALTSGVAQAGTIAAPQPGGAVLGTTQYTIQVPAGASQLRIDLNGNPDVDLYVRFGQRITIQNGAAVADFRSEGPFGVETIIVSPATFPTLRTGTYYIAVGNFGPGAATFNVMATVQ
ncbi:MAG: zinc-dependent metalloprotease family protein [Acidobacteriota bacterium]|nr:zinc-dependent metalloprotease family protein [Acidobacteriota bacterium]